LSDRADPGAREGTPPATDGRHRRSQRSRERILDAVTQALSDPDLEVTAERVAAEAGVSLSTIFRHFGDMEGLSAAMAERLERRVVAVLLRAPFRGPLRARIADVVDRRIRAAEISRPLRRAAERATRRAPDALRRQAETRADLRAQLVDALGPEIERAGPERLEALDTLLSFEALDRLSQQEVDAPRAADILEGAVAALLAEGARRP
jgi:AcrR family transcriptional regulator